MATSLLLLIYLAFIGLGLPDALLGGSWPVMQSDFGAPYGWAGLASMLITGGTAASSILATRLLSRFGTGRVTAASVALTAMALSGFAWAPAFPWILAAAVPLGLGAGAVDAGLNAYVAEHYESRHMSWLHAFWGLGALGGPLLLSILLGQGAGWRSGYQIIGAFQAGLALVLCLSLPLWARSPNPGPGRPAPAPAAHKPLFFPLKLRGVPAAMLVFFCYCGIEATLGLWGGSYLFRARGMGAAAAAMWVSLYYGGITGGRLLTGFLTYRLSDADLIRAGVLCIGAGVALLFVPILPCALAGIILVGLGCAPIFPCMLHATPVRFGAADAQAVMGFQMAVAYTGLTLLPPAFGWFASRSSLALLPWFLAACLALLAIAAESLRRQAVNRPKPPL